MIPFLPPFIDFRDSLKLCDNIVPSCGDKDTLFCDMDQWDVMGHFEIGIDFIFFKLGLSLNIGNKAYSNCDEFDDGTLCGLGSTCDNCKNPASESILCFCYSLKTSFFACL